MGSFPHQVNSIMEDREGNIWIGLFGGGLICMNNLAIRNYNTENGLLHNFITDLSWNADSNRLFVGTLSGLIAIRNQKVTTPLSTLGWEQKDNYVYKIFSRRNTLWLNFSSRAPTQTLFTALDHEGWTYYVIKAPASLAKDSTFWTGDWSGKISEFQLVDGQMIRKIRIVPYDSTMLNGKRINCLLESQNGRLFIGTDFGLFHLIDSTSVPIPGLEFVNQTVKCLYQSSPNSVWVASAQGLINISGEKVQILTKKDGLASTNCTAVISDREGKIWVGTMTGLSCISSSGIKNFYSSDGLASDEVNCLAYDSLRHRLWVGTSQGLSEIDLSSLPENQDSLTFPVVITEIEVEGKAVSTAEPIQVPFHQNDLRVSFVAPGYASSQKAQYQYRLKGTGQDWTVASGNQVEFPALSPGAYVFEVRARKGNGSWGAPSSLAITIFPPIWEKPWFLILTTAFLILVAGGILYWQIRNRRIKNLRQTETARRIAQLKHQALSASMNPHFIFNSLNSVQQYLNVRDKAEAHDYLARFARLIRMNMDCAQRNLITIEEERERLDLYLSLEKLRFGDRLDYKITISPEIDPEDTDLPSMLIQPFVENAIWHGLRDRPKGKIEIEVSALNSDRILVKITDNGVGFYKNQEESNPLIPKHDPKGIALSRERIEYIGMLTGIASSLKIEELKDEENATLGTQVSIVLPVFYPAQISMTN